MKVNEHGQLVGHGNIPLQTVPCRWCGKPTPMLGTKECNQHWELMSRIEREPEMARRMLKVVEDQTP